jgi:hypothetical protein
MVIVYFYNHFRIWTRIRNPRVTDPDPAKVPDPCGSGSTTLIHYINISLYCLISTKHYCGSELFLFKFKSKLRFNYQQHFMYTVLK